MGLFQKQPINNNLPLYSLAANKTLLVVGLGNPGREYETTRHNIGFEVINEFAQRNNFPSWNLKKDLKCELTSANLGDAKILLCKPQTFMNDSGESVEAVQRFYKIYNDKTLVVYDELAIKFGALRTRVGGSDAGHNGIKSLIAHIGEDFNRLRVGVGNDFSDKADSADFVLGKFTKAEQGHLKSIKDEACSIITEYIFSGELPHETRQIL